MTSPRGGQPTTSFDVPAAAYQRFMGRYSEPLAAQFVELLDLADGQSAIDIGAGPGAVTVPLVERLGVDAVVAIDPSTSFVTALRERIAGLDAREASAEALPFATDTFDLAVAQLVVQFMTDPVAGLTEMARVVTPGGVVAASVWDFAGGRSPLSVFWSSARSLDPGILDESSVPGARSGHLVELFRAAGLSDVRPGESTVSVSYADVDEWWSAFTPGVGPAGKYLERLDARSRLALREECASRFPVGPVTVEATAWTAVGTV